MKKITLSLSLISLSVLSFAQNNVGIGTTTPDASSKLEVTSTNQGVLVPRIALTATNAAAPVTAPATSLLVYNTATAGTVPNNVTPGYYYWDGVQWVRLQSGSGSASCVTLDEAYDCTSPGAGRIVTVNDGSIEFNQTAGTNTEVLTVTTTQGTAATPVNGISTVHSGVGNAIIAEATSASADQAYAPIVGSVSNSTTSNAGVLGLYNGSGAFASGGTFQVTTTDGGIGMLSVNGSPSPTQTNYGGLAWSLGGSANNYGFQGVVGNGSGTVNSYTSADVTTAGLYGVNESTTGGAGVFGIGVQGMVGLTDYTNAYAIYGQNFGANNAGFQVGILGDGGHGVWGQSQVLGGVGVYGLANPTVINGNYSQTTGVAAALVGDGAGVVGEGAFPDWGVVSLGDLGATGTKTFIIDHPEDPENKALKHFSIESNEVLNVYRGTAEFDANGVAVVTLPTYFDELNINFSYQLTAVGAPSPNMYVSKEVQGTVFEISGGAANAKVSWTVYAERNDKYLQVHPEAKIAEVDKADHQKGKYLDPATYGKDRSQGIISGGEILKLDGASDAEKTQSDKNPIKELPKKAENNSPSTDNQ
ncbi:hypothetical protein K6119_13575 [Paracrocinitomix mangrovi]|uniref:hypothetical protein n=1 Tax=Paracrocinitomix mangrovi TaxID=2862509 RepID=UPI001C8DC3F9|nr:hypothetical protein [Paracrocinitomix mangrovi]UKN00761.1 hypothetical protein K6119_13575 [Paracrocinitomix mangrovi]